MITRVSIENLVVVDRAELELGSGLISVTGETGAGKTLFAMAIGLLFGAEANAKQVGPNGEQAWVEGEFEVSDDFWTNPDVVAIADLRPEEDAPLVLARRITEAGRSRAFAWGRSITRGDLEAAGRLLVATSGQHSQRQLVNSAWQRSTVDAAGGPKHSGLVTAMADSWSGLVQARSALADAEARYEQLSGSAQAVLEDIARIEAVQPSLEEKAELDEARTRIRNVAAIADGVSTAVNAMGDGGAVDSLGTAWSAIDRIAEYDSNLAPIAEGLLGLQSTAGDLLSELRASLDDVSAAPADLERIESRLSGYDELHRAFGGTTEAVMARWEQLKHDATLVSDIDSILEDARAKLAVAEKEAAAAAKALSTSRKKIAGQLADQIREALAELGMGSSVFEIACEPTDLSVSGTDHVEMRLAPGAAVTPAPIASVASGGELSRISLAIQVASGAPEAGTLLFDEVDAGIGGHTAHAVAKLLARLAEQTQVLCITHLPQVAARADEFVHITRSGAQTTVSKLKGEDSIVDELCRMLGADPSDPAARQTAIAMRPNRITKGAKGKGKKAPAQAALDV